MYEWYLSILDDDDQEVIRFLRSSGEEHMARKPTSLGMSTGVSSTYHERLAYMKKYTSSEAFQGGTRSKWERIGHPLFTPGFEMAMFFTPMNPFVYRSIRLIKHSYDASQGLYDD
jgi:hypothetical protein